MKRDLKADLEYCKELEPISLKIKRHLIVALGRRAKGVTVFERWTLNAIDGWPYAIRQALEEKERADKCEALVRELLDVLGRVTPRYLAGRLELDLDLVHEANGLLKKAKEVLGDETR